MVSKERQASQIYAQVLPKKHYVYCVLEVKAQVQSSAVVSKEREASQNYAQALSIQYCICCVLEDEGSGAKQCNGFEGKISKSELCTGTAEEVLFIVF